MTPMDEVIQLLKQIADHTSHDNSVWVAAISGSAGVLGAATVAVVSYFSGRRSAASQERIEAARLHTNLVSAERLRWLQDIRKRLSHLFVQMDMQYDHLKRPVHDQAAQFQEKLDTYSMQVMEETNFITLMLNPEKVDQAALRNALQEAQQFLKECFMLRSQGIPLIGDQRYAAVKQTAFDALTSVGVSTWARIKSLE